MAEIVKNKTSTNHSTPKESECYAKLVLEWYDNKKYKNLILQDKPDLYSKSFDIGIEVTDASGSNYHKAHQLWIKSFSVNADL